MNTKNFCPKNTSITIGLLALLCAAALSVNSCDLPGGPGFGKGTLTLGLSSHNQTARSVVTDAEAAQYIRYDYTLNGPGGTLTGSVSGTQNVTIHVDPGNWTISVKAYGKKHGDQNQSETVLRGTGTAEVQVNAGKNTYTSVKMTTATEVTTWDDLVTAIGGNPDSAYPDREEIIIVKNDLTADSTADIHRKITIITDNPAGVKIIRAPGHLAQFFDLRDKAYLTLGRHGDSPRRLVIDGNKGASIADVNKALITLYEPGTLLMNDGVHLTGNYHNYGVGGGAGGAVEMSNGTFIMNGGEISGNSTVGNGGAVYMNQSFGASISFTMNGGLIADNMADINGGGVYMYDGSTYDPFAFTMNGGEITGNKADLNKVDIIDGKGGGVFVGSDNTFNYNNGTITSNEAYRGGGVYVRIDGIFSVELVPGQGIFGNTDYDPGTTDDDIYRELPI